MAEAIRTGTATRNAEVMIEKPDGSRFVALVNIRPLRDHHGDIQGAINCFQDISARKAVEDELRRKNAELDDFFENAAVPLHIVSGEGIILRANQSELDLLGYTADEYIGRHIATFHAEAPVIGEILERLSCGERLIRFPAQLRAKDGSIKHVLITSSGRFEDGRFANTRCFTIDVTDLYEAEAARADIDGRLAATYEAANVGITEADHTGRILRLNDALCRILDMPREQLLRMSFLDYTHEDDRERDAALYARQVRGELEGYSIRKKALRRDGTIRYLDVSSTSVRDPEGRFRYGVRVIQDVTEAKTLEDRIRDGERHMRELLEALPAAVYTTDQHGRVTFYNKAAVEMTGRIPQPDDEWCVSWRLYRPDGTPLPHDECPMAVALKEQRAIRGAEAVAERPDGTRVPFMAYPTPLRDAEGNVVGAINMMVDITQRKQAEAHQKALVAELNHRVKNTLATVQSLALHSAKHSSSITDFAEAFQARLLALAKAHDLLTKRHWKEAPLDVLLGEIAAPFAGKNGDSIKIDGPAFQVDPKTTLSLTMTLNELCTNAAKYGALSSQEGALSVSWKVHQDGARSVLHLDWNEHGGPRVTPPTRRGFGTRLMKTCIEHDLAGQFDLAFDAAGVRCQIKIPVNSKIDQ